MAFTRHRRTVSSSEAEASKAISGDNANAQTESVWPSSFWFCRLHSTSQTCIVCFRYDAEASDLLTEGTRHILRHGRRRGRSIHAGWQASDDHIVSMNASQRVRVVVLCISRYIDLISFVQHSLNCSELAIESADDAYMVVFDRTRGHRETVERKRKLRCAETAS